MSFLEGHVADCNSSLGGWFSGRVSYFGAERYDSSVSLLEIALKSKSYTQNRHVFYECL